MSNIDLIYPARLRSYLSGFFLALMLTAIPFALVALGTMSKTVTFALIAVTAVFQVLVHLRYFLHLTFSPRSTWFRVAIAFTAVIMFVMIGGTLWILFDLNRHMVL